MSGLLAFAGRSDGRSAEAYLAWAEGARVRAVTWYSCKKRTGINLEMVLQSKFVLHYDEDAAPVQQSIRGRAAAGDSIRVSSNMAVMRIGERTGS